MPVALIPHAKLFCIGAKACQSGPHIPQLHHIQWREVIALPHVRVVDAFRQALHGHIGGVVHHRLVVVGHLGGAYSVDEELRQGREARILRADVGGGRGEVLLPEVLP